ncbi:MAG: sulfonate/nitrate/taurine transporter substrate-binding protein [Oscillospiraceae bacterium]|nr:MAG: sulfonate/nitrate/taurine transporter substrate-binding protein [Oscillospiraceae bacterium]
MGMVQLMKQEETSGAYEFSIFAAIDEVTPKIVKGEVDIAAVPANMAAVLYNNTQGQIRVIGINTLGVLYIVESGDSVGSVADLKGKTLYASGKGATPEYALNYILQQNGLTPGTDVTIEWKSEHAECVAALASDPDGIAMLPQPFVATAQAQNPAIRIALDLTAEWDAIEAQKEAPSALLTGVVVARADYIDAHPQELAAFLSGYDESVGFVNTETEQAAALIEEYGIVAAPVAQAALPYCNIVLIQGAEMKEKLSGYLNVLFEQNPKAVGGSLPDDAFYYGA